MTNLVSFHEAFSLPAHLHAHTPAELRGNDRSDVKLLHTERKNGRIQDRTLTDLTELLQPNDLLLFNRSRTIPAQLVSETDNVTVRLARQLTETSWEALILGKDKTVVQLQDGVTLHVQGDGSEAPLKRVTFQGLHEPVLSFLHKYGDPIRYEYINTPWSLEAYQTVFASVPGSIEMPSAGRAFSWKLIHQLKQNHIQVGFLTLHAGISYYEDNQWPDPLHHPEAYTIPAETIAAIHEAKARGGRIIAVGTTVVRAVESYAQNKPSHQGAWTDTTNLFIQRETPLQLVDGLLSGLHEPHSSHLELLRAFLPDDALLSSYQHALQNNYLWHEFGDVHLML